MTQFLHQNNYTNILTKNEDIQVQNWFFMGSITTPIVLVLMYLLAVFKIVPEIMKNRKPYKLTSFIAAYNLTQIAINGYLFVKIMNATVLYWHKINYCCQVPEKSTSPDSLVFIESHYYFGLLKFFDLMETIIFVLRKKESQVTFLHVYHHVGMAMLTWIACKYFPAGQPIHGGTINLFVHVVMHTYYLLSVFVNPKYLWWKKYVTTLQIVQHYIVFSLQLVAFLNPYCLYPKWFSGVSVFFMLMMIYLFTRFYVKNYVKENKNKKII